MFFFDEGARTLVCVRGMKAREWLKDHSTFKEISAGEAGEISAREGFSWTLPIHYYGGSDRAYDGATISTAVAPDHVVY